MMKTSPILEFLNIALASLAPKKKWACTAKSHLQLLSTYQTAIKKLIN
jgi:hypothetical protein